MKTVWIALVFCMIWGVYRIQPASGANASKVPAIDVPKSKPAPDQPKVTLPLSEIIKQPLREYSYEQLKERFNQFKHVPFDKSGYIILTLPFRFKSTDSKDDNREALAFSFLLSNALDWGEANYCTRHAYFVFKRSEKIAKLLSANYYRNYIRYLISDWGATGAIGGVLKKSDKGFTCTVFMYDRAGKTIWKKIYDEPTEYFELLGKVATDALRQMGEKVSPELEQLLKLKRCKDHQSILDLGAAAFAKEKTEAEFGLYKKILTRDPDFGEVRFWWSNQQHWVDGDKASNALEIAKAFESYPNEEAFRCFNPEDCPNETLIEKSKQWPAVVEKLLGSDSYILMDRKLEHTDIKNPTPELLAQMTQIGEKYPNQYWYLSSLARQYDKISDYYYEMSICLAAIYNNYIVAKDRRFVDWQLGYCSWILAYNDIGAQFLKPLVDKYIEDEDYKTIQVESYRLGNIMREMGHYTNAAQYFIAAYMGYQEGEYWERWAISEACFCALLDGNLKLVDEIIKDKKDLLKQTGMLYIIESYKEILSGKPVTLSEIEKKVPTDIDTNDAFFLLHQYLLYSQIELIQKTPKPKYRKIANSWLLDRTYIRLIWDIFDRYDRAETKPESSYFYEVMEWLHGNDPWVQSAVADFKKRGKYIDPPSAEEIIAKLKDYPVQKWPLPMDTKPNKWAWTLYLSFPVYAIQARIHRLIEEKQFDKAEELTARLLSLAYSFYSEGFRAQARQIMYLIQDAKQNNGVTPTSMPATAPAK